MGHIQKMKYRNVSLCRASQEVVSLVSASGPRYSVYVHDPSAELSIRVRRSEEDGAEGR